MDRGIVAQVQYRPLRAARSEVEYRIHLAALEWSLADAIVINKAEDIKSQASWRDRLEPFEHQVHNLFTFCRRLPVTLLADDVGLGKTISAGLILSELMIRRRVRRALVIAPSILGPQWLEELDSKFAISGRHAVGAALSEELEGSAPVVVTTYDSARGRMGEIQPGAFDMLILDEAHKLRNLHGTAAPPALATCVRNALEDRLFKYVLMLTATPIQNRLWDLYSLIDCLTVARGHRNPLGNPDEFEARYVADPHNGSRRLQSRTADEFRGILRQYIVRTRRGDAKLKFPTREVRTLRMRATNVERRLQQMVASVIEDLNGFQQSSIARALMSSPQALATQLENMAEGDGSLSGLATEARRAADLEPLTAKLDGLMEMISQLQTERSDNWRVVVFTIRKETQLAIARALQRTDVTFGFIQGGRTQENQRTIQRFRMEPPEIHVVVSTDAGAEGVNLQVANVVVNYDLPWNPMIVEQRIGRVQRLASAFENVVVFNLVVGDSVEDKVVARLMAKLQSIAHTVGDIEAILESTGQDGDEEDETSFESQIRDLVVKSLLGQDVREATRLKEESIDRAQQYLEERREEIDGTLGQLDELHQAGPSMPELAPVKPSVPLQVFVLDAIRAEGAQVEPGDNGTYLVRAAGRPPESIAFDEDASRTYANRGVFLDAALKVYQQGSLAFERLVQRWVDTAGAHVLSLEAIENELVQQLARSWCETVPGAEFCGATMQNAWTAFQGDMLCKTKAGNGVDSYEKLVAVKVSGGHGRLPASVVKHGQLVSGDHAPEKVLQDVERTVQKAVAADADVGEFCRFYEARLEDEQQKAGEDRRRLKKIEDDLLPVVSTDVVGLRGVAYSVGKIEVRLAFDGQDNYAVVIEGVPATDRILDQPRRRKCEVTQRLVPEPCLETCAVSQKLVLKHLLVTSEETGRRGLAEHAVRCEVTGKLLLEDETARSAITGKVAAASQFKQSAASARLGLPEDFVVCQITGASVLSDELVKSDVSGKYFRCDQRMVSAVSGVVGHSGEFVTCAYSGDTIVPSEAGQSALTGKTARKDKLVASERRPHRPAWPSEMVRCSVSGKQLLRDEVETSAVSGRVAERGHMLPSQRSERLALPDELVTCEESGLRLLPSETDKCSLTGKTVDQRLLARSDVSGKLALRDRMVQCEVTGKSVLPTELAVCELTGRKVVPTELDFCAISGQRVLRGRLVKSAVSDQFIRADLAVRSVVSRHLCAPSEATTCAWLDGPILPSEAAKCHLTGLQVAKPFLNHDGELVALRRLLDGRAGTESKDLATWLKTSHRAEFGRLLAVHVLSSPSGRTQAFCCEVRSGLLCGMAFGFRYSYVGGVVVADGNGLKLVGRVVRGQRTSRGWSLAGSATS